MKDYLRTSWILGVSFWTLMIGGCLGSRGYQRSPKADTYTLKVKTEHFDAKSVEVYCGGMKVRTLRDLRMLKETSYRIQGCLHSSVSVRVNYLGRQVWVSPPISVGINETLSVHIASFTNYNIVYLGR